MILVPILVQENERRKFSVLYNAYSNLWMYSKALITYHPIRIRDALIPCYELNSISKDEMRVTYNCLYIGDSECPLR